MEQMVSREGKKVGGLEKGNPLLHKAPRDTARTCTGCYRVGRGTLDQLRQQLLLGHRHLLVESYPVV